jgi:hypothetical protein
MTTTHPSKIFKYTSDDDGICDDPGCVYFREAEILIDMGPNLPKNSKVEIKIDPWEWTMFFYKTLDDDTIIECNASINLVLKIKSGQSSPDRLKFTSHSLNM